jgi:hypothetical protein
MNRNQELGRPELKEGGWLGFLFECIEYGGAAHHGLSSLHATLQCITLDLGKPSSASRGQRLTPDMNSSLVSRNEVELDLE